MSNELARCATWFFYARKCAKQRRQQASFNRKLSGQVVRMLFLQGWKCLKIPVRLCKDLKSPMFWDSGSIPILRCWPPNRNRFTAFQSFFLSDQLPLPKKWTAQASWPFAAHVEITFTETVAPLGLTSFLADPSLFFARHARCGCQYWQTVPLYKNEQEIRGTVWNYSRLSW